MQCCINITSSKVHFSYVQTILIALSILKISLPTMAMCFCVQNSDTLCVCFDTHLMISNYLEMWTSFIILSLLLYEWGIQNSPHFMDVDR